MKTSILQVHEWEEEISQLKSKLERSEKEHKDQILNLESVWNERMVTLESEKSDSERRYRELELRRNLPNICGDCCKRGETAPHGRQTDAEKMWQKTMLGDPNPRTMSQSGLSTFTPHVPLSPRQGVQGPSSLPVELVNNAHREVRRLQELRRYIQEECDHLLLKKERLKEEVGQHYDHLWHAEQSSMSLDTYLQSGERVHKDVQATHSLCDMAPYVAAHKTHGIKVEDSLHLSSIEQAYKVLDKIIFTSRLLRT